MPVEHLPADVNPDLLAKALERDGCAIVDRLAEPAVMDRVHDELAPWFHSVPKGVDEFSGHETQRIGALIARSKTARELLMHPTVLGCVERVLAHATSFQVHLTQIIAIGPGETAQAIHRDQWAFDFFPFPQGYEVQCNTLWAMTDFTEENGATRVIPGSHRFEDKRQFKVEDTEPAEMEKGSVLLYTGALYHGGGANRSAATRTAINLTYALSWLRQEENQYLSVPVEIARGLPLELQRLMGYRRGAYALGYVDDLRDPIAVLDPDAAAVNARFGELSSATAALKRDVPRDTEPSGDA